MRSKYLYQQGVSHQQGSQVLGLMDRVHSRRDLDLPYHLEM